MHSDYVWFLLIWFETNLQTSTTRTIRSKANRTMERKIKFKQNKNDCIWSLSLIHFYLPHLELVKFKIRGHDGQLIKVTIRGHHYIFTTLNGSKKIKTKIKNLANDAYGHFQQNYCEAHFEHAEQLISKQSPMVLWHVLQVHVMMTIFGIGHFCKNHFIWFQ